MLRNIGILAHVDAGKTTITEHLLYTSGKIRQKGSVDDGTASTDWLDVEKKRGISVYSAFTSFLWKDVEINLIDTPGHADFSGEVQRTLRILDGAILVISAAEGVEAQTEILWNALNVMQIPVIIFINKIDRKASNCKKVLQKIKTQLSPRVIPVQFIEGEGNDHPAVYDIFSQRDVPAKNRIKKRNMIRNDIFEILAENDEEMLAKYVHEEKVTPSTLKKKLVTRTREAKISPILYGSALKGIGIVSLLNAIVDYLPAPDINRKVPLSGVVFKVNHDSAMGKLAHVRLFNGNIENRDSVYNMSQDITEKVTQIRKVYPQKYEDIGVLKAGDIGTICGFKQVQVGDVLGHAKAVPEEYKLANPLLKVQAYPENDTNYRELVAALQILAEEDPLLNLQWFHEEREIQLNIMGMIQLEILESILRDRYQVDVSFDKPSVIYKETPATAGKGYIRYTMPKPCWAVLLFEIKPGPRGSGVKYCSEVRSDTILPKYQKQVEEAVPDALEQGLYGWEVTDLEITLIDGEYHVEHTHPPDFTVATPMGIMDGLSNTGTTLLEPVLDFRISVPEDMGGKIMGDLIQMRAEIQSPRVVEGRLVIEGVMPVASSLDYPVKLSSRSAGKGIIKTRFSGYQECPLESGEKCPRRGVNPLDKSRYILSIRNAID